MKEELSPITGKPMKLITEIDSVEFRGEKFTYHHLAYKCEESGEQFTTSELDAINANQVYNAFRERHGYPFPEEIAELRNYYGLSASKMSVIMGFGANQWRYYEADKVPSESNSRTISAIRNKTVFLDFLEEAKSEFDDKEYFKIKEKITALPDYVRPTRPTKYNGYKSFSANKVSEAIKFFAANLSGVFVTKMNKLLFYADFLKYKRDGFGLTGLEYRAIKHGPVPVNYGEVYSKSAGVQMDEYIYPNGTSGILLCSDEKPDMSIFSETEKDVLYEICDRFKNLSAGEISEYSHKEKGWIDCAPDKGIIPYNYAFNLSI